MKLADIFGALVVAMTILYFGWVLSAQDTVERVVRSCEPVYFAGKPFISLAKLHSSSTSRSVEVFVTNREKDCRFIVYDMFYASGNSGEEGSSTQEGE